MRQSFTLTVNGQTVHVDAEPDTPLLTVLRNDLDLKGPRLGCGLGMCGACFVRLDGHVMPSCDTPMWSADGKTVVTVEGLGHDGALHPVQEALLDGQAAQCAFCISGVIVSAAKLLEEHAHPDEHDVAQALDRNLCRCGAQGRIIKAIVKASEAMP